MTTITNNSLSRSIENLISYALTDSDNLIFSDDFIFNEPVSDFIPNIEPQENQETSFKNLKRKALDHPNQPAAKKTFASNSSSPTPENSVIMYPSFKRKLRDTISQIYKKANALSLEKTQMYYANQLNIDLQEIKKIYISSTHCSTGNESSIMETKTSSLVSPKLKKNLIDAINRTFDKVKPLNLEKIQTYYANQLKVALSEIKNICLATSTHYPTKITKINSPKELDALDLILKKKFNVDTVITISSEAKKNLVKKINYLFCKTDASLEKIQTYYANQLKVDLQEIKKIYFAISTNDPSANEISEIKQKTQ